MLTLTHTLTLKTTIDETKAPADMVDDLAKITDEDLPKLLNIVFVTAALKLGMFDKMNKNNHYATVEPVWEELYEPAS